MNELETLRQPSAPVAVVLPNECPYKYDGQEDQDTYEYGWEDYDAEVRRLNAEVITVAELERLRSCEQVLKRVVAQGGIISASTFDAARAAIQASQSKGE